MSKEYGENKSIPNDWNNDTINVLGEVIRVNNLEHELTCHNRKCFSLAEEGALNLTLSRVCLRKSLIVLSYIYYLHLC